jgi:hypothetical protein
VTKLLSEFRTIDGSGNNQANPTEDTPGTGEGRIAPANFAVGTTDGLVDGPNPRTVSDVVSSGPNAENIDPTGLSAMMYVWGQFIDHDLDLSPQGGSDISINVPSGDPTLADGSVIPLTRFMTGTAENVVTGWLDGSMIYGSDPATAASLRLPDGHLATSSGDNLPIVNGAFIAGDVRATENPDLTAITTLFVREHNHWVDELSKENPAWTGDQLYQEARAIVVAEIQNITYTEFLPHLLGEDAISSYTGYKPSTDARITQEFSAAAFRFGHSIVSGTETKLATDGTTVLATQSLADAFSDTPSQVEANGGVDALLRGIVHDNSQANDVYAVDELRNLLSASPDTIDLIAIDIQRERDLGLGTLNETRAALGLSQYSSFSQITSDPTVAAHLQQVYGTVDNVDLFIGGLAEDHVAGAMVGSTFESILVNQFTALRDGDRFWWQNEPFDTQTKQIIANRSLADIIGDNTDVPNGVLSEDVFVVPSTNDNTSRSTHTNRHDMTDLVPGASAIGGGSSRSAGVGDVTGQSSAAGASFGSLSGFGTAQSNHTGFADQHLG